MHSFNLKNKILYESKIILQRYYKWKENFKKIIFKTKTQTTYFAIAMEGKGWLALGVAVHDAGTVASQQEQSNWNPKTSSECLTQGTRTLKIMAA